MGMAAVGGLPNLPTYAGRASHTIPYPASQPNSYPVVATGIFGYGIC